MPYSLTEKRQASSVLNIEAGDVRDFSMRALLTTIANRPDPAFRQRVTSYGP